MGQGAAPGVARGAIRGGGAYERRDERWSG
jgi:hypothetical protein